MQSASVYLSVFLLAVTILVATDLPAQDTGPGTGTPTGLAGSFGGSIETGAGTFDPLERNASRSVTDMVVPGAVVPFTFTRIWNSRGSESYDADGDAWTYRGGNNWSWTIEAWECAIASGGDDTTNDWSGSECFFGYIVSFPDGRRIKFNKPPNGDWGGPGTYPPNAIGGSIQESLVIDADRQHARLYLTDGSVVTWGPLPGEAYYYPQSITNPHGLVTTFTYDAAGMLITEPGKRWIRVGPVQYSNANKTHTMVVTSSLGQRVTYVANYGVSGTVVSRGTNTDDPSVITGTGSVTYNNVIDPSTNLPLQANSVYKKVQAYLMRNALNLNSPDPPPFYRLEWASEPMFDGPVQNVKYVYAGGDDKYHLTAVLEERYAAAYYTASGAVDPGVMFFRVEMLPYTYDATNGYSPSYYDRKEIRGNGSRIISYYNSTLGMGQKKVDHITDFDNPSLTERSEWGSPQRNPTAVTDMRGNKTVQTIETVLGNVTRQTHPDASYRSWTYTGTPKPYFVASATDELGRATFYTRDPTTRRVTRIDYPGGTYETFVYNAFGQVTSHQLPSGAVSTRVYDAEGLLVREYNTVDGWAARIEYTYDTWDRVLTVQDGRARAAGALYSTKTIYNNRHQPTEIHYPSTGILADPKVVYGYDRWGRRTSATNELNYTTTTAYDAYGRRTALTEPLNAPNWNNTATVASRTTNWTYDRYWNGVTYSALSHVSGLWRTQTTPAFNSAGDRAVIARWIDFNDRITLEDHGWIQPVSGTWYAGPDRQRRLYAYDGNDNKIRFTDPLNRVTTYDYDNRDRLWKTTEPSSRVTENNYDFAGNKKLVKFPDLKTNQWLDFDGFGQPARFIDERGNTTNFTYRWGPMKELASVTTSRTRDDGTIEPQVTSFLQDSMGRPTKTTFPSPDGSYEQSWYVNGQVTTMRTRRGEIKTILYDARGREDSHSWADDAAPAVDRIWDDAGRLAQINNKFSTIVYNYDRSGQVITERNTVAGAATPGSVSYQRYPDGKPAHLIYPNNYKVRRTYTAAGQLAEVDAIGGTTVYPMAVYDYNVDGTLYSRDSYNGVRNAFAYDDHAQIRVAHTYRPSTGASFSHRTYFRDARKRIYAWQKLNDPVDNPLENGRGDQYRYDAEGQLYWAEYESTDPALATPPAGTRRDRFSYDALGNRQGAQLNWIANRGWTSFVRTDNGLNQYTSWTPGVIRYDDDMGAAWGAPGRANGVLMEDGYITAGYNALNQPRFAAGVGMATGDYIWFGYDPLGRCVKRWIAPAPATSVDSPPESNPVNGATYMYYDGWNIIQDDGGNPATASKIYLHGARVDELVGFLDYRYGGAGWKYPHYDARGDCILLTDPSGNLVEQYQYDAFGKVYIYDGAGQPLSESARGNRFLFQGREWLSELKLYDFRHRLYQPELGRFLQPDPIGIQIEGAKLSGSPASLYRGGEIAPEKFPSSEFNLYRYCHNDPINKTDPLGLDPGQGFDHPDLAVLDVHNYINATSIRENREYGSVIYKGNDGKFYASEPFRGGGRKVTLGAHDDQSRVRDGKRIGDYHSHADYSKEGRNKEPVRATPKEDRLPGGYGSDHPSLVDKKRASDIRKKDPNYKTYLGTPGQGVKEYDGAGKERVLERMYPNRW